MDSKKNETAEITSFNTNIVEPAALVELNDAELAEVAGGAAKPTGTDNPDWKFCLIYFGSDAATGTTNG
ncbi:MAG TPA: hypothetical protein PK156_19545 [Polyangium sp.]|nr:hypothetical protein [Polyangium sp.]